MHSEPHSLELCQVMRELRPLNSAPDVVAVWLAAALQGLQCTRGAHEHHRRPATRPVVGSTFAF
eukprot:2909944-Alexandrium_andersonii.AAC.1